MILGPNGQPVTSRQTETRTAQLRGGVMPFDGMRPDLNPGWTDGTPGGAGRNPGGRYGISRADARRTCRTLYYTNGLFQAAVDITAAFLVGDAIRYGTLADPGLQTLIDEFWEANSFSELLTQRVITEWFLDGELAFVFPTARDEAPPPTDRPALIGMLDVDLGGFSLEASTSRGALPADMVSRLILERQNGARQYWDAGEFTWAANNALHNDPRGWPVAHAAAEGAVAYIAMMNMRLNVHYVQQRVLAVYKALFDPNGLDANGVPDGGVYQFQRKVMGFRNLPERGGVLPVMVQPGRTLPGTGEKIDGFQEDIQFLQPAQGAADAASDMRLLMRLVGLCMGGLPEHYLGEGGNATRTTAASMGLPAVRLANKRQASLKGALTRVFRAEVRRRAGPDAKFKINRSGRKKVPIDLIELPWVFPEIREESLDEIIRRVQLALDNNLISEQTATADLGYDPALEADRRANQAPAPPAPAGDPSARQ